MTTDFDTLALMLADNALTYATVAAGSVFRASKEGFSYVVAASSATDEHLTTAGGIKLYLQPDGSGQYNFKGMNPAANGTTDDYPKLARLLATLSASAIGGTNYKTMDTIFFPNAKYKMGSTIELKRCITLRGGHSGINGDQGSAKFLFPVDTAGIIVNHTTTLGGGVETVGTGSAQGTRISGISIVGVVGTDTTKHGIQLRSRALIEHFEVVNFSGNGVHIRATAGATPDLEGNANNFSLFVGRIYGCRNGVYCDGADANAGVGYLLDVVGNREWGIYDSSFLGNTWIACHTASNGKVPGPAGPSAYASFEGQYYHAVPPSSPALLSATQPGTNPSVWRRCGPVLGVTWTGNNPEGTFRLGGSYYSDNSNAKVSLIGCYAEGNQGAAWLSQRSIVLGGFWTETPVASGAVLEGNSGFLQTRGINSRFTDPGSGNETSVGLGGAPGVVLSMAANDGGGLNPTGTFRLTRAPNGYVWNVDNSGAYIAKMTAPSYVRPMKFQIGNEMILGRDSYERYFGRSSNTMAGVNFPTSGSYTKGDVYLAANPNAGDKIGFVCTTSGIAGSTAVFKAFGAIDA